MKRLTLLWITLLLIGMSAASGADGGPRADAAWRSDFSDPEELRKEWKFDGAKLFIPRTKFFLADEPTAANGRVLVIEAPRATGLLLAAPAVDLAKTPIMRWRWRVVRPLALRENEPEVDDQAAVIYFGDGNLVRQKSIGYRWEHHTPVGCETILQYAAGTMTVHAYCVANRQTPPGVWRVEEHDTVADFKAAYGVEPNPYFIISIGGNSQYSKSDTRAEIDFIEFVPRTPPEEAQP